MTDEHTLDGNPIPHTIGEPEPEPTVSNEPEGDDDPVAALRAEFETERQSWRDREARFMSTIDSLVKRPADRQDEPDVIDWDNLPDPVEKPAEFKTAISQAMAKSNSAIESRLTNQINETSQINRVWNDFSVAHPDLAKKSSLATTIAVEVSNSGIGIGDERFIPEVAKRMKAELNITDDPTPAPGAPKQNRTGGVRGGSKGGAGVVKNESTPAPKNFTDQLTALQADSGLY